MPTFELEDTFMKDFSNSIADVNLPAPIDRSSTPKDGSSYTDTIVLLSQPDFRLSVALEGGKIKENAVLIAASPDWLEKRSSPLSTEEKPVQSLYLKKGISFNAKKQAFIDSFDPPRRVTYFANFLTMPCTENLSDAGVPLEENIDCPMSSSSKLEHIVNDKLLTRILLARYRVAHPFTLAFPFMSKQKYETEGLDITIAHLDSKESAATESSISEAVEKFLKGIRDEYFRVVVKPSGPLWMGSRGVSFFSSSDSAAVVKGVKSLLAELDEGDAVLVESYHPTLPSHFVMPARDVPLHTALKPTVATAKREAAKHIMEELGEWALDDDEITEIAPMDVSADLSEISFRLRVLVARTSYGKPVVSKMVCGVGLSSKPVNGDNTIAQSLDATLDQWGITDPSFKADLHDAVNEESVKVMESIIEYESNQLSSDERGGRGAQTELIGIDFILTPMDKVIVPIVIEVNDHDCTLQCQILEFTLPHSIGESVRPWVLNMFQRSQTFQLQGKTLGVVGAGGHSKMFVWPALKSFGMRVVLIDDKTNEAAMKLVDDFVHIPNIAEHRRDEDHVVTILEKLKLQNIHLDGVTTFWEDCTVLAALVAEALGLQGNPVAAQKIAKSKTATHLHLLSKRDSLPHRASTCLYAVPTAKVTSPGDLKKALKEVRLPGVMKLEYGSSAVGTKLVTTPDECKAHAKETQNLLKAEGDHPGIGLGFGNALLLMEYINGSEHDVDIVVYGGRVIGAFVTDNGPTRLPYFCETSSCMPSRLHQDQQAALAFAAFTCVREVGLTDGVFNVELKMTSTGPKLIEINGRMGGFYIRDWCKRVWGVDLLQCVASISVGLRPVLATGEGLPSADMRPLTHCVGIMILPTQHVRALRTTTPLSRLRQLSSDDRVYFTQFEEDEVVDSDEAEGMEEPLGNLAICGRDHRDSKRRLVSALHLLGLEGTESSSLFSLQNL